VQNLTNRHLSGKRSERLGELAQAAFEELLIYTFGSDQIECSSLTPDHQGIDLVTTIVSRHSWTNNVRLQWQVKARTSVPQFVRDGPFAGRLCYKVRLNRSTIHVAMSSSDFTFVALGIPRANCDALLSMPAIQQFDWYAIDCAQALEGCERSKVSRELELLIPVANVLNVATLSLLWGSVWTARQARPIVHACVTSGSPDVTDLLSVFRDPVVAPPRKRSARQIARYEEAAAGTRSADRTALNYQLGTAIAMQDIRESLNKRSVITGRYLSYANESLSEQVHTYLFSRWMREYLFRYVPSIYATSSYQRFFPTDLLRLSSESRAFRCALYHAAAVHVLAGCGVMLSPAGDVREHVLMEPFGRFHGMFQNQPTSWQYHLQDSRAGLRSEIDFFASLQVELATSTKRDLRRLREFLQLSGYDVRLTRWPFRLMSPESMFIEHPLELTRERWRR